jgi:hypothetical protein
MNIQKKSHFWQSVKRTVLLAGSYPPDGPVDTNGTIVNHSLEATL